MDDNFTPEENAAAEAYARAVDVVMKTELTPDQFEAFCLWNESLQRDPRRADHAPNNLELLLFLAAFEPDKQKLLTDRLASILKGEPDPDRPAP